MNRLFIEKSNVWTKSTNEAKYDNDHSTIIITICFVERSKLMKTKKQCMVVKMNKIHCLVISSKINYYDECNYSKYMNIAWFIKK